MATSSEPARSWCAITETARGGASRAQWDGLAEAWDLCEDGGLAAGHVADAAAWLATPCLVVGSGHGLLVEALRRCGFAALGVDHSPAMAWRARARRGVRSVVARAEALPFSGGGFGSLVAATGVLDPTDPVLLRSAVAELARVVRPEGTLLLAFFEAAGEQWTAGEALGLLVAGGQRHDRLARLWRARRDGEAQARLVAAWASCSAREAAARLAAHRAWLWRGFALLSELAARAGSEDPEAAVAARFAWTLPGLAPGCAAPLSGFPGLSTLQCGADPASSVRWLILRRLPVAQAENPGAVS